MSNSAGRRRWTRGERWAAGLALAAVVVTWNATFDRGIVVAAKTYLAAQRAHKEGRGPAVQVHSVMQPAIADSARRATIWSLPVACLGIAVVRFVRSRTESRQVEK
jgi:hypothetical protein